MIAAERDLLSSFVDIATIVVAMIAIGALWLSVSALKSERDRFQKAGLQQIALAHHARIYSVAAQAIADVTAFTRLAEARVQARGSAAVDHGLYADAGADELLDPLYAELLDRGATRRDISAAHDTATQSLDYLWFFISPEGDGMHLLEALSVVSSVLSAVRPRLGSDAGDGELGPLLRDSALSESIEATIRIDDDLRPGEPMARLRVARELATRYLRFEIGLLVRPPSIVSSPPTEDG